MKISIIFFIVNTILAQVPYAKSDRRIPVTLSESKSRQLSLKMISFLRIITKSSMAIQSKQFDKLEQLALELQQKTRKKAKPPFSTFKQELHISAIELKKSAHEKDLSSSQKNFSRVLNSCLKCHTTIKVTH